MTELTETITGNAARVRRYRAKHRRLDYTPAEDVLNIVERIAVVNPTRSWAEIIDYLVRAGHKAVSGKSPTQEQ